MLFRESYCACSSFAKAFAFSVSVFGFILGVSGFGLSGTAQATPLSFFDGEVQGTFDSTVTWGFSLRTEKAHKELLALSYGNRLYADKWDVFANAAKASHDLSLKYRNFEFFARGNYFYDFESSSNSLRPEARDKLVYEDALTDAFVLGRFGSREEVTVRVGKQVISWGENTFYGGSLNDINTVDIRQLRQPGVELKDALLGTPAIYATWNVDENWTLEGFVLGKFDPIELDPSGGFFQTDDFVADGGGGCAPFVTVANPCNLAPDAQLITLGPLARAVEQKPNGGGQFGVALRYYTPDFHFVGMEGIDVGFYYQRLHDHVPAISAVAGAGAFYLDYVPDVDRWGVSFNTLFMEKIALSGEYSYRPEAPYQGKDFFDVALGVPVGATAIPGAAPNKTAFAAGTLVRGWDTYERHQLQFTGQYQWPVSEILGANRQDTIGEVLFGYGDYPSATVFNPLRPATSFYSSLQVRHSLQYPRALFGEVNIVPQFAFKWDVDGVSGESAGLLVIEGRKSASVGVTFEYLLNWQANISYTTQFGGTNPRSLLTNGTLTRDSDRDFASFSISYAF